MVMATRIDSLIEKSMSEPGVEVVSKVEDDEIDPITESRIARKADTWLLPLVVSLFLLNFIDRSAVGKSVIVSCHERTNEPAVHLANANVAGLAKDLDLGRGVRYNIG